MNFNMNIVMSASLLVFSQSSQAVYNWEWNADKDPFLNYVAQYTPTRRKPIVDSSKKELSPARPPVEHYGDLTARLLALPAQDLRTIGVSPRPMSAPVDRKNILTKPSSAARQPCIITNGCLVYCLDQMIKNHQRSQKSGSK